MKYHLIDIQNDSIREELKIPFVSADIIEYLNATFDISYMLTKNIECSESMRLGYIKGVQDVIDSLLACQKQSR